MSRVQLVSRLWFVFLTAVWLPPLASAEAAAPAATPAAAAAPAEPVVDAKRASYGVGLTFGAQLRSAGVNDDVAMDSLMQGIKAGMGGTAVAPADQQQIMGWVRAARVKLQGRNEKAANEFLAKNGAAAGVVTTTSGLQYKVVSAGDSKATSPKSTDQVSVNYRGQLLDGTEFDSSYKRGQAATFPVTGVIPGWTEALQLMKPGAKWELYIPAALAYGNNPPPGSPFEPGMMLKFDVELLKVMSPPVASTPAPKAAVAPKAAAASTALVAPKAAAAPKPQPATTVVPTKPATAHPAAPASPPKG